MFVGTGFWGLRFEEDRTGSGFFVAPATLPSSRNPGKGPHFFKPPFGVDGLSEPKPYTRIPKPFTCLFRIKLRV